MTRLSVNINKVATLRNARGGNVPNVVKVALDCESFGADGITVHPRPDERHIRKSDVYDLRPLLRTEFNIEGYPAPEFIDLVLKVKPHQVTLVSRLLANQLNNQEVANIAASTIAIGGTIVNGLLAAKTSRENKRLRAYYAH